MKMNERSEIKIWIDKKENEKKERNLCWNEENDRYWKKVIKNSQTVKAILNETQKTNVILTEPE